MNRLRTISIKTQVRRLKYFTRFIELLEGNGLRTELLCQRILKWSQENHEDLLSYPSKTGEIVFKPGKVKSQGFQNYLDASIQFKILNEERGFVKVTRLGRVLETLLRLNRENKQVSNEYRLTAAEKNYFLYLILQRDADWFIILQKMLMEKPGEQLYFYIGNFQEFYLNRLKAKLKLVSPIAGIKVNQALQRVMQWRIPNRYCEHIVPSRLNWLLDLGLISEELFFKGKKYKLNHLGETLYKSLRDLDSGMKDIDDAWIYKNMQVLWGLYIESNKLITWARLSNIEKDELLMESIFHARKNFSVLNLPRLSLSQTLLFTSLYLISKHKVQTAFNDIINHIGFEKKIKNVKIGIRRSERPEESYIWITNG